MMAEADPRDDELPIEARTYSLTGVVGLYALLILIDVILGRVLSGVNSAVYGLASLLSLVTVIGFVLYQGPRLLSLSRWHPEWIDLIGVPLGIFVAAGRLLIFSDPIKYLGPPFVPAHSFIPAVLIAPMLEEILFRATFLNSLERRMSRLAAISLVTLLAVVGHGTASFWLVLPSQFTLCVLYVALKHSLPACILCHTAMNLFPYLPVAAFYRGWHASWN